jgi:hypothetical protein
MAIVSASLQPYSVWSAPHFTMDAWAQGISALIQQCGVTKTQLTGFGIFPRVTMRWQQTSVGGGSPAFSIPTNMVTGDFMLVAIAVPSGTTITTPTGWTFLRNDTATGGTGPVESFLYWRIAAGTAGAFSTDGGTTVNFNLSNTSTAVMASLVAYAGVNTSSPFNVQGVASSSASGTTATSAAVTTTVANSYVLQIVSTDSAAAITAITPAAGYTARTAVTGQGSATIGSSVFDAFQAAAGTTGTPTWTLSSTGSWIVQTLALVPALSFVPTVTAVAGGTLTVSTTYYYRVAALNAQGSTLPCNEVSGTTAGSNLSMQLTWTAVALATGYAIYGRTTGAEQLLATVGAVTTWTDTGALTPSGAMPTADTSADSGQVNFGALPVAIATSTKAGFEIYQLTDSLQAAYPVFIRVDYGMGGSTGNPQIWLQSGSATNGSGTIQAAAAYPNGYIGVASTANVFASVATTWYSTTTASPMYCDSDGGISSPTGGGGSSLMIAGWANALGSATPASSGGVGIVERTREWNGTVNTEGVIMVTAQPNQAFYGTWLLNNANQFYPATPSTTGGPASLFLAAGNLLIPNYVGTVGPTVYIYPLPGPNTPKWNGPSKHLVCCWLGDVQNGATFTITQYGATHTFMKTNGLITTNLCACFRTA